MIKKIVALAVALVLLLPSLVSCDNGSFVGFRQPREVTYYQYFDTVINLSSVRMTKKEFEGHIAAAEERIKEYHRLFDIYYEYSGIQNLCTLNRAAGKGEPTKLSDSLFSFLESAVELYGVTGGKMNVMLGAVTSLWNTARRDAAKGEAALPAEAALAEAKKHISIESLVLDKENKTAYINDPLASIDVGAFAKGYAAERVAELLLSRGVKEGFVLDFGGNLRVLGGRAEGEPFVAGIHDPSTEVAGNYVEQVQLCDGSLVTSGSYFRYFEIAGKRYHHLIDPESARPADRFASVSVMGKDSGLCDALSTALVVSTYEEGCALIQSLEGYEAVWILPSGEILRTDGIDNYIVQ